MKTKLMPLLKTCAVLTLLFTGIPGSRAQLLTNVVTVRTIYGASEPAGKGLFSLFREGPTNNAVTVFYSVGGTASNGVDYATLSGSATIPVNSRTADIVVSPIDDSLVEGNETVTLTLLPSPTNNAPSYSTGYLSYAVMSIRDNDNVVTNQPPTAHMISPSDGATFVAPIDIRLVAYAQDPEDGYDVKVEFFAGTNSLGFGTFVPSLCPSPYCPNFALTWSNVPPGGYILTARATDKSGATGVSDPVHISVLPAGFPVVTIVATDPHAAEGSTNSTGDTGSFTVYRTGSTNSPMRVFYHVGGTASNGVDFSFISNSVTIPAGALSANILVKPIDDNLIEGTETVEIAIEPIACIAIFPPPPDCYLVGFPHSAVVFIEDNDRITNVPPRVHIVSPTNGAAFVGPLDLGIKAEAADVDDDVIRVDFFANDHVVGSDVGTNQDGYGIVWSNALPGFYLLQARALDSRGASGLSDLVRIAITGTNPPPTNLPPVVTIFAVDPIAAEGTNWCRWYSNSTSPLPDSSCTNTATFLVRRAGSTNASLTISYAIGGTASNGVDYLALPGSVTIPAGERSARITIYPVDDSLTECFETVILGLRQPTNLPPAYVVGWPSRAAAIIVDNDRPLPDTRWLCDGIFHLCVPATNGFNYRLECSLDLIHWLPVGTAVVTDLGVHFVDPESQDFTSRFYRVMPELAPPQ
jgi:hypothetical protein